MANTATNNRRWLVVNKNTLRVRTSKDTRSAARAAKRSSEYIFDAVNGVSVR